MRRKNETPVRVRQSANVLKIELPMCKPTTSKSGKTMLVASTYGVLTTEVRHNGRPIALVANAFVYPKRKVSDSE
jgi:hypothetical protein